MPKLYIIGRPLFSNLAYSLSVPQLNPIPPTEHMEPDSDSPSAPLPPWVLLEYKHILLQTGIYSDDAPPPPLPTSFSSTSSEESKDNDGQSIRHDIPLSRVTFSHLSQATCNALTDALATTSASKQPIVRHLRSLSGVAPALLSHPERVTCSVLSVLDLMSTLRINIKHVCLLDPKAPTALAPSDTRKFKWFLFGGILGDDPPRDRTGELRAYGFPGRHLGDIQMTTDTAVAVTKRVVEDGVRLEDMDWVEEPEMGFRKGEWVAMPFRYLRDLEREKGGKEKSKGKTKDGREPLMPEGMRELIESDLDRGFEF